MMEDTILEVENLRTSFATDAGRVQSVRGITFHVGRERAWESWGNPAAEKV